MDVSEAACWFATTPLEGWDGSSWVADVAKGDFHTYDRFITERTFGAKKRIFLAPLEYALDFATYPVVRTPDGLVWIVVTDQADLEHSTVYQYSYLLLRADFTADIIAYTTTTLASGQESDATPTVVGTSVCDMERFTGDQSDVFETVNYSLMRIVFPNSMMVDTDHELLIDGLNYEVQDVSPELLTWAVRALRRTA